MSQNSVPGPDPVAAVWLASLPSQGYSQDMGFAAGDPDRHSWRVNSAQTLSADELDVPEATRSWLLRRAPFGIFLIVGSGIGFFASFALAAEKYEKLENPNAVLSCDFNPFFSCGSVMEHPESQLFGFPNQLLGIAAFIFPLLIGVLILAGTKLPGWVQIGLSIGLGLGVVLVMFLFYISIYAIGVGCPWCIVVWTVTIPMFVAVTARNLLAGHFGAAAAQNPMAKVLAKENIAVSVLWLLIIAACIVTQFWSFFASLF